MSSRKNCEIVLSAEDLVTQSENVSQKKKLSQIVYLHLFHAKQNFDLLR